MRGTRTRLPLLGRQALQLRQALSDGHGFGRREILAADVLVAFGQQQRQGVFQAGDDIDGYGFPAELLDRFQAAVAGDQLIGRVDDQRLQQAALADGRGERVQATEILAAAVADMDGR